MNTDVQTNRGTLRVRYYNDVLDETNEMNIGYIIDSGDTLYEGRYMNLDTRELYADGSMRVAARIVDQVLRPGAYAASFDEVDVEVLEDNRC